MHEKLACGAAGEAVDHRCSGVEDIDALGPQHRYQRSIFKLPVIRLFTEAFSDREHDEEGALTPGLGQFSKRLAYGGHQPQCAGGMIPRVLTTPFRSSR